MCDTTHTYVRVLTHSYVWKDSFICEFLYASIQVTWLTHISICIHMSCITNHQSLTHCQWVTAPIHTCDTTHPYAYSYVSHDSSEKTICESFCKSCESCAYSYASLLRIHSHVTHMNTQKDHMRVFLRILQVFCVFICLRVLRVLCVFICESFACSYSCDTYEYAKRPYASLFANLANLLSIHLSVSLASLVRIHLSESLASLVRIHMRVFCLFIVMWHIWIRQKTICESFGESCKSCAYSSFLTKYHMRVPRTGWRRCIGCLEFQVFFPQKSH